MESTVLLVYVGDVETSERSLVLEGSTRIGQNWRVVVEGAAFGGAEVPRTDSVADLLGAMRDPLNKTGILQDEDFLRIEVTRYF